jgi:hypothetical protein
VVPGLDFPVGADECRQLGEGGLPGGQVEDRVDGLDGDLPGLEVGAAELDLDRLPGSGEEQVVLEGFGGLPTARPVILGKRWLIEDTDARPTV